MPNDHWNAEDYRQNSAAQQHWAQVLIAKLNFSGTESVLDVGCGDGKVTAEIASHVEKGQVIGIDSSASMIGLASREYPANRYPNLSFQLQDARELKFDGQFDVVFSNAVLHWIKDHPPVLAGLYRSLRPGGRMLLQMGAQDGMPGFRAALKQVLALPQWRDAFQGFACPYGFKSVEDYQMWLPAAGFLIKRVELITKQAVHTNEEAFKGWIRTTWHPYSTRLPESQRPQFIQDIAACYLESHPPEPDGRVAVTMIRLEVEAEKLPRPTA